MLRWHGELLYLSDALVGEPVGIAETDTGDWLVSFTDVSVARINRQTGKSGPAARRTKARADRILKSVNDVAGLKCQ
jgi:hypothetical protein